MATLVFVHGNGFCKEAWRPVARRVQQSAVVSRLTGGSGVDCHAVCLPLHGDKHDQRAHESAAVFFENEDTSRPRVRHAMNDWSKIVPDALFSEFKALRERCDASGRRQPMIGVGHSMGAATLWATEARNPGMFDGLVLFEPVYGVITEEYKKSIDFLVGVTLKRDREWPSKQAARAFFESYANFSSWDRESLRCWVDGAIVTAGDKDSSRAILANHPLTEAAVYAGPRLELSDAEIAGVKCRVHFHYGSKTRLLDIPTFQGFADRHPDIYSLHAPMQDLGHLMIFEDPVASSNAVIDGLEDLLGDAIHDQAASCRL